MQADRIPKRVPVGTKYVIEGKRRGEGEVHVDPALGLRARVPIDRMLAFTAGLKKGQSAGSLRRPVGTGVVDDDDPDARLDVAQRAYEDFHVGDLVVGRHDGHHPHGDGS